MSLDIVEVSSEVYDTARKYLGFQTGEKTRVMIEDAGSYVKKLKPTRMYDFIFLDAYIEHLKMPPSLTQPSFISSLSSHLSKEGVLLVNFCVFNYTKEQIEEILQPYLSSFDHLMFIEATHASKVLLAWNKGDSERDKLAPFTSSKLLNQREHLESLCPHFPRHRRGLGYLFDLKSGLIPHYTLILPHHRYASIYFCKTNKLPDTFCKDQATFG